MARSSLPNSSGTYQLFQSYVGSDEGALPLLLLPPSYNPYLASTPIAMPLLWAGGATYDGPDPSNADFRFSVSQASVAITLLGVNMWAGLPAARLALMDNFTGFLAAIETDIEAKGLLHPGSTYRIGQQIAAQLPVTPAESLFYRYSLSPGLAAGPNPYVDVRPGMRLRVDVQASQFVGPTSAMNGYVGSGSFELQIGSKAAADGSRTITFDPFLASLAAPLPAGSAASPTVAGGTVDLQPPGGGRAHWRLFYPRTIASPSQAGDVTVADNVTLVGATSLAALNAATLDYPGPETSANPPTLYTIFLGRTMVVPEIPVWVSVDSQRSALEYVSLGTTLGDLLERFNSPPVDPNNVQSGTLMRRMPPPAPVSGTGTAVTLYLPPDATWVPRTMWDVPVIAGDIVTIPTQ